MLCKKLEFKVLYMYLHIYTQAKDSHNAEPIRYGHHALPAYSKHEDLTF